MFHSHNWSWTFCMTVIATGSSPTNLNVGNEMIGLTLLKSILTKSSKLTAPVALINGKKHLTFGECERAALITSTVRTISLSRFCNETIESEVKLNSSNAEPTVGDQDLQGSLPRDPVKDRTKLIPLEDCMRYMYSSAYKETYGDNHVWVLYRRNFKGQFAPKKTRRTCIRGGLLQSGNPCPICRDEYLLLDYRNVDLLKQFISPFNGEILSYSKTGLCQVKHRELLIAIEKALDQGLITFDIPFRDFYSK